MTSRRTISKDTSGLANDGTSSPLAIPSEKSNTSPAVPTTVIYKLLGFTAAMVVGPIGTYFLTVNTIFGGSSTWAGAMAAIVANVVLIAYVIVAMKEDQSDRLAAEKNAKKAQ